MKTKKIVRNSFNATLNLSFHKIRHVVIGVLFAASVFAAFHSAIHNKFDSRHNSDCPVYVLEQLFFGADVVSISAIVILFLPFIFSSFTTERYSFQTPNYFSIRAPPLH